MHLLFYNNRSKSRILSKYKILLLVPYQAGLWWLNMIGFFSPHPKSWTSSDFKQYLTLVNNLHYIKDTLTLLFEFWDQFRYLPTMYHIYEISSKFNSLALIARWEYKMLGITVPPDGIWIRMKSSGPVELDVETGSGWDKCVRERSFWWLLPSLYRERERERERDREREIVSILCCNRRLAKAESSRSLPQSLYFVPFSYRDSLESVDSRGFSRLGFSM